MELVKTILANGLEQKLMVKAKHPFVETANQDLSSQDDEHSISSDKDAVSSTPSVEPSDKETDFLSTSSVKRFEVDKIYFMCIHAISHDNPKRKIDILMDNYRPFQKYYETDVTAFDSDFEIVYPRNTTDSQTGGGGGNLAENVFANALPRGVCIEDVVNV